MIEKDKQALSDITVFNKYARFDHDIGRRETFEEIVTRNKAMHRRKFPQAKQQIDLAYDMVFAKKLLPSMRSMQFGGQPIEMSENRIFNCAYAPCDDYHFFSELMFLLLGGTGMGYSVQARHVDQLPSVKQPKLSGHKYQIQDSIIGWADAVKIVCKAFFKGGALPTFDYRDIRPKNAALITTGGKAPGPEPLRICVEKITKIFTSCVGRKLRPIEAHDIACVIADAVLAGGIRRAAMISLFDRTDEVMIGSKANLCRIKSFSVIEEESTDEEFAVKWTNLYGETSINRLDAWTYDNLVNTNSLPWYIAYPYRGRANNSAVLLRGQVTEAEFTTLMKRVEDSKCGEPGVYWTNNLDWGTNPCCEIALRPFQMCNLTEINASTVMTQNDLNERAWGASVIGTLQAAYTDFHYLRPVWRDNCEDDALLGVSMTGIASKPLLALDLKQAAQIAKDANKFMAELLGIKPAARVTTVKPAGTTSLTLGCSSGIHAWHNDYYIRRMRAGKDEALAQYMLKAAPALVEQDVNVPHQVVLSFPQKAPEGAIVRTESMMDLLERVKKVSLEWVANGHRYGDNKHNVSCTISVKDEEWPALTVWMWENRDHYNGISVLPYFGAAAYPQLPFEDCTEETYLSMLPHLEAIDITQVREENGDAIDLAGELACSGGACEVK